MVETEEYKELMINVPIYNLTISFNHASEKLLANEREVDYKEGARKT